MSLINQVLRDLDAREPLQNRPVSASATVVAASPSMSTDWARLAVWTVTGFLITTILGYVLFIEKILPEPVAVQAASATLVSRQQKVPLSAAADESVDSAPLAEIEKGTVDTSVPGIKIAEPALTDSAAVDESVDIKITSEQKPAGRQTATKVAYLPLRDDGKKIKTVTRNAKTRPKQPVVVKRAARLPLVQAKQMIDKGRLAEAEQQLIKIVKNSPSDINARELLIGLLLRSNRSAEAEDQVQQALKVFPGRENLVLLQARSLLDKRDIDAAVELLERQVRINKAGVKTLAMLAPLYQQKARYEESTGLYRQLIQKSPAEASYWVGLGVGLEALQQSDEAASAYQRAVSSSTLPFSLQQYAMQRISYIKSNHAFQSSGYKQ